MNSHETSPEQKLYRQIHQQKEIVSNKKSDNKCEDICQNQS